MQNIQYQSDIFVSSFEPNHQRRNEHRSRTSKTTAMIMTSSKWSEFLESIDVGRSGRLWKVLVIFGSFWYTVVCGGVYTVVWGVVFGGWYVGVIRWYVGGW